MEMIKQVIEDVDVKVLTTNNAILILSRNQDGVDMSMVVEHLKIVALKMLHHPDVDDSADASKLCRVTLLDDVISASIVLL